MRVLVELLVGVAVVVVVTVSATPTNGRELAARYRVAADLKTYPQGTAKKALASVGGDLTHIAKITVFVTDPRFREPLGEVRKRYLGDTLPASTLVTVAALASPDLLIEIEATAILD